MSAPLALLRIIDANLNRASEALRVMEDLARFALNHSALSEQLKNLRHNLLSAINRLPIPPGALIASRDASADVGISITNPSEQSRANLLSIAASAGSRATQALRVLEESSKTLDTSVAREIESIRYQTYSADQQLQLAFGSARSAAFTLCLILTQSLCKKPWQEVVGGFASAIAESKIPACIQVREKSLSDSALLSHIRAVIALARPLNIALIVNDRPDLALLARADGVHLGADDLPILETRKLVGRSLLIGASTHNLAEARAAVSASADYCGVGAMFPTALKPDRTPSGPAFLQEFITNFPSTPYLAIGGLTPPRIRELRTSVPEFPNFSDNNSPTGGCAISSAICAADDPAQLTRECLAALA